MIEIGASTHVRRTKAEMKACLRRLDEIYPQYSPGEHVRCEYIRGDPMTSGSVLAFEERIAGRIHRMRYRVARMEETADSIRAVIKAMFPRSLLNISAEFSLKPEGDGVRFSRIIRAGWDLPLLGALSDAIVCRTLGRNYVAEMERHAKEDIGKLGAHIERGR
jgi:hypothetical protein